MTMVCVKYKIKEEEIVSFKCYIRLDCELSFEIKRVNT